MTRRKAVVLLFLILSQLVSVVLSFSSTKNTNLVDNSETIYDEESTIFNVIPSNIANVSDITNDFRQMDIVNDTINGLASNFSDEVDLVIMGVHLNSSDDETLPSLVTPLKPRQFLRLFKVFVFKGFGIMFAKSILKWNSFGIGIRIPITANFPDYERLAYLPRVNSLVGCSFPFHLRWTVSVSIPLQIIYYCVVRYAIRPQNTVAAAAIIDRLMNPKETDMTQRIGVTVAIRYNRQGFKYTLGSWINNVPSKAVLKTYFVPAVTLPPAVIFTVLNLIRPIDVNVLIPHNNTESSANTTVDASLGTTVKADSTSTENSSEGGKTSKSKLKTRSTTVMKKKKKYKRVKGIRKRNIVFWHQRLKDWAKHKTISTSCSLGWFKTHHDAFMGSNINFDVGFFRPFRSYIESLKKQIWNYFFHT